MVVTGLGLHAINNGYTVCFEKMVSLVKILDTVETERSAGFRLSALVLITDGILRNIPEGQDYLIDNLCADNRLLQDFTT